MSVALPRSFSLQHFIDSIPLTENEKAARYPYLSYCYGENRILGEYYTPLIANYFGLEDDPSIYIAKRLSSYLRAYTIVDDDLKDTPEQNADKTWPELKTFFLDRVREEARLLSKEGILAEDILEAELGTYHRTSEAYSKKHAEGNINDADDSYIDGYADRMATIRVPFLMLGSKVQNTDLTVYGCRGIDDLIKSLQLLDDLVDWKEDLGADRLTYPFLCYLATLLHGMEQGEIQGLSFSEKRKLACSVKISVNYSRFSSIARRQLELAAASLDSVVTLLAHGAGSELLGYVDKIRHQVAWALSTNGKEHNKTGLIRRIRRSGAAPLRSLQERGRSG
jgi:hypothetical protein